MKLFRLKQPKKWEDMNKTEKITGGCGVVFIIIFIIAIIASILGGGGEESTKTKTDQTQTKQETIQEEPKKEGERNLSEQQNREIYRECLSSLEKIQQEAQTKYPSPYYKNLEEGKTYTLKEETTLAPGINSSDPIGAIALMKKIPAGTSFRVEQRKDDNGTIWYKTTIQGLGEGWIISLSLISQFTDEDLEEFKKQNQFVDEEEAKIEEGILNKYKISREQFWKIFDEGVTNKW